MADYKATAAQLASIANAIRIKGGTSAALEYPSEWITAIQNLVPASGGSEITPVDPTIEYKVTDTELISIANAIRTKAEISGQLEFPNDFISGINSIPDPGPQIVSWAEGTDAQIAAMVAALDAGTLTIADTGWQIGDERVVSLSAIEHTNLDSGSSPIAQNVVMVILDSGHFDLTSGGKDHFVVGVKRKLLSSSIDTYRGYVTTQTSVPATDPWKDSLRRTWLNENYRNAIPEPLRSCFKQFRVVSVGSKSNGTAVITDDYFTIFSAKEVFGTQSNSAPCEANATSIIKYYESASRSELSNSWLRSIDGRNLYSGWLGLTGNSAVNSYVTTASNGFLPFGCI